MKRVVARRRRVIWRLPASIESLEPKTMMVADAIVLESAPVDTASMAIASDRGEGEGELVPDFSLVDVNPNSATYGQNVSPQDFRGSISGYYFGHAT